VNAEQSKRVAEVREGGGGRRDCRRPEPDNFPGGDGNWAIPPPR